MQIAYEFHILNTNAASVSYSSSKDIPRCVCAIYGVVCALIFSLFKSNSLQLQAMAKKDSRATEQISHSIKL